MTTRIDVTLVFPGKPISKDNRRRPITDRDTGAPAIVIPRRYKKWERTKRTEARLQVLGDERFPIRKPTKVRADLIFAYPYEPSRVDIYNSPKSICDALGPDQSKRLPKSLIPGYNPAGPIYEDDNQIWIGSVLKVKTKGEPVIIVRLRTITEGEYRELVRQAVEATGYDLSY